MGSKQTFDHGTGMGEHLRPRGRLWFSLVTMLLETSFGYSNLDSYQAKQRANDIFGVKYHEKYLFCTSAKSTNLQQTKLNRSPLHPARLDV